ncbi:neogenin isoform X3 [Seriola lalandi dorsalis]|uniref:neogenin isoform X3 n=1 Tax=Seriola lalandi dorsalis TaxID=1841481 RepID=UPI000C6F7440|nr:neogenin isoform X3 [Seriola lalandi dorsalis]XP_056222373.1 neogenin 1a isoform X3 [Seriola aureovittata]
MAERGALSLLSLLCLTFLYTATTAAKHVDKGSAVQPFIPFWFTVEPQDTLAIRGSAALLNCSAHSDAATPARIEWKKDGTFMSLSDERRHILPDGTLFFTHVVHSKHNKPDEGTYQCVATIDNLGSISSRTARLSVAGMPRFASQPAPTTVRLGDSQVMACEVNSDLVPFTRWEKDRQPLEPSTRLVQLPSGALVISNASEADAGLYRCMVENVGSSKSSDEAQLQILPETGEERKLELLVQPVSVTKVVGASVLLPCVVAGYPAPHVRWMFGDKLLQESEGRVEVVGGGSLQISNLTEEDAGVYTCMADNSNATIEAQAQLTVQVPPQFVKRPANIYAHESMDIVFECEVSGSPAPTVKWVKNGDAVIPSDYFKIIKEHNLQVLGLVKSDEGFYQCLAENDAGNIQSSAQLIILDHDVALPSSPPPSLTPNTTDHVTPGSGGVASPAGPTPSAPRDVVASLVSTRFIKLTWRPPAEPHGDELTYSVFYSQEGTSRERVVNTSRPGEMQVTIQNLMPDTKYRFRVVAHNSNGQGESSTALKVATQAEVQVPGPAPNLLAVSNSPTSVSLSWDKPLTGNGEILTYKLYYTDKSVGNEEDIDIDAQSYTMTGLKKNTEYSFRVVANNKHGPGVSTEDITVRTLSDVPSGPPQNLTLEVQNSKSIMLRWQPPPLNAQNGEITGYKIRYRKGSRRSEAAETTGGTQLSKLIDGLERGTEYSFRVSAMTVNGTGPATDWTTAETFESDLDESRVPDQPSSLHVRPLINSIVVSWTPPENQDIVVRGYTIGYGIGSPHAQTIKVDYKQRYYTIENLDPSSHYVITLKAFNNVGEGIPVYESAITRPQSDPIDPDVDLYELFHAPYTPVPDPSPMMPPVGVQASVLSHDTIKVTWADNSLPKNQKITDNRYYTVRWKTNIPANTKVKMANTTSLNHMVTGLKPNTLYEFSVMVTKGRRTSTWSMTAQGTTFETIPSSSPKDVTVVSKENKPRTIIVNWQPPSEANGKITGYIIYYSTDVNAEVHDWVIEPVVGNRLTHQIQELTLDTTYYFKIQARNSKGMGPMSEAVNFRTPKTSNLLPKPGPPGSQNPQEPGTSIGKSGVGSNNENHILVIVIIISVGAFTIIVVVVGAFLCTRRTTSHQKKKRAASKSSNGSHKYKGNSKDLKPPDLWIHHERLELKPMDKSPEPNPVMTETPIPRTSQDITPADSGLESNPHLQQRRNSYRGHESEDSMSTLAGRRGMRPKMMMPFDAQPPQPVISAHPIHSLDNHHHHYHMGSLASPTRSYLYHQGSGHPRPHACATPISHLDRVDSTESVRNTPNPEPIPQATASSQVSCPSEILADPEGSYHGSTTTEEEPSYSSNLPPHRSAHPHAHAHPLKSFAVPAIPATSHPSYESPALPSTPLLAQTGPPTHPHVVKTASIGTLGRTRTPMVVTVPNAPDVPETSKMLEDVDSVLASLPPCPSPAPRSNPVPLPQSYEPDELTEEMAHLEGLMKDLNAITTAP